MVNYISKYPKIYLGNLLGMNLGQEAIYCDSSNFNKDTRVNIFVNGIANSLNDALANLDRFRDENAINCLVYNSTEGIPRDIGNSMFLKLFGKYAESAEPSIDYLKKFLYFLTDGNASNITLNGHSEGGIISTLALLGMKRLPSASGIFDKLSNMLTFKSYGSPVKMSINGINQEIYINSGDGVSHMGGTVQCDEFTKVFFVKDLGHIADVYATSINEERYVESDICNQEIETGEKGGFWSTIFEGISQFWN